MCKNRLQIATRPGSQHFRCLLRVTYVPSEVVPLFEVDPNAFARYAFRRLIRRRTPRYQAIADRWGVSVSKGALAEVANEEAFLQLIAQALDEKSAALTGDSAQ